MRAAYTLTFVVKGYVLTGSYGALRQVEGDFDLRSVDTEAASLIGLPIARFCCATGVGFWHIDEPIGVGREEAVGHEILFPLCYDKGICLREFVHNVPRCLVRASASTDTESLSLTKGEKRESVVLTDLFSMFVNDRAWFAFDVTAEKVRKPTFSDETDSRTVFFFVNREPRVSCYTTDVLLVEVG